MILILFNILIIVQLYSAVNRGLIGRGSILGFHYTIMHAVNLGGGQHQFYFWCTRMSKWYEIARFVTKWTFSLIYELLV